MERKYSCDHKRKRAEFETKMRELKLSDYAIGIAVGTGYLANDAPRPYLVVRNVDSWFVKRIEKETGYRAYPSLDSRNKKTQWTVKARNIHAIPSLEEILCIKDFCRSYIELHGLLDTSKAKDKKGNSIRRLRLRIYGKENILSYINQVLPAKEKKLQYISNQVEGKYTGKTCALYYQSKMEILAILKWLHGEIRNETIWKKWEGIIREEG